MSTTGMEGHERWAVRAIGKGFSCVQNTLQQGKGKATLGYEAAKMVASACPS